MHAMEGAQVAGGTAQAEFIAVSQVHSETPVAFPEPGLHPFLLQGVELFLHLDLEESHHGGVASLVRLFAEPGDEAVGLAVVELAQFRRHSSAWSKATCWYRSVSGFRYSGFTQEATGFM